MAKRIEEINVSVPVIVQNVGGDLVLRGREGDALVVDGDNPQVEHLGSGQPYLVRCGGDCRVSVPSGVDVVVQRVGGDARIAELDGNVEIENIGGDLTVGHVAAVAIHTVGGDLRLKWTDADARIENVGGDATVREVGGSLHIQNVGADLFLRTVEGSCVVEHTGDDLVLNVAFHPGHEYRFNAGSDILCRIQPDTGARFVLPQHTRYELDVEADVTTSDSGESTIITIGDGGATVRLTAGGELRFIGEEEDYVFNLGAQIEEELEARLSSLEEKLAQQFEGLDERLQAQSERFAEQAAHFATHAARQAERQVDRARRSLDRRKMKSRKRDFGEARFTWGFPPEPPKPPRPPVEPVREEERLMILRMVQENKITIEEAERLLAALEQRD